MEKLRKQHNALLNRVNLDFERYLSGSLPWESRLMGIKGARGVGKTTLLLQYIMKRYSFSEEALYISLDNIYFSNNRLIDLVENFVSKGGKHIFIDEVHKYKDWSIEFKNIYDQYPDLKLTFTGSSLLHILNSRVDLSRRALTFNMKGLSFREYLNFVLNTDFSKIDLNDILDNHVRISLDIIRKIKPVLLEFV